MVVQQYKRTWCDYLTPCKIKPEIMVGSYECQVECPLCVSSNEEQGPKFDIGDYARYSYVHHGHVCCDINDIE